MLENLNGIFLIGTCSKKDQGEYKDKDGKTQKSYRLYFDYMGGSNTVTVDDVIFSKVEQGSLYVMEVKPYTNENMKGNILLAKKGAKLFEILENNQLFEV